MSIHVAQCAMKAVSIACDNWDPLESYGQIANVLARHLAADGGVQVNAVTGWRPVEEIPCAAARSLLARPPLPARGGIVLGYPTLYDRYGPAVAAGPRLAVTMFESTALPSGWVEPLERCAAVVVPSPWLVDVFRTAGVTVPIHVLPLGVSDVYRFVSRPPGRRPFTFLAVATKGLRKGWDVATRAFDAAFGLDPAYRLVIKLRAGRRLDVHIRHPHVKVLAADLDEPGMLGLFAAADAFVCPTRGEGFGLPPREAAATGLPVIATNWGGTADHIEEWGIPLPATATAAWPFHRDHPRCGEWAEPDVAALARLMREVATAPPDEAAARLRSQRVASRYAWADFAAGVAALWREIESRAPAAESGACDPEETPAFTQVACGDSDRGGLVPRPASSGGRPRPRVVIHARPDIPWHDRFVRAASVGLRASGVPFAVSSAATRGDAGLPILLGTTSWRSIEAAGAFLLVDRCSFGDPGRFVSLVRDGHGRRGDHRVPARIDPRRWERHGVPVLPWRSDGRRVILCGQTETYSPAYRGIGDWYADVAAACTHFRRHPAARPDAAAAGLPETDAWDDCGRAVTLNSSVGVETVLRGIPTVTMDEAAMAWDVTGHRLDETAMPDRTEWLHWLAWTQWTYEEIMEGTPWPSLLD